MTAEKPSTTDRATTLAAPMANDLPDDVVDKMWRRYRNSNFNDASRLIRYVCFQHPLMLDELAVGSIYRFVLNDKHVLVCRESASSPLIGVYSDEQGVQRSTRLHDKELYPADHRQSATARAAVRDLQVSELRKAELVR